MKTVFVKAPYEFKMEEIDIPSYGKNEVLLKVMACGICGSDLNTAASQAKDWKTFGHEISGIVEAVGENVENVKVGDTVIVESGSFCGTCENCRNGRVDLCTSGYNNEQLVINGFSEYMVLPKQCLVHFSPEKLSYAAATVIEPMGVALDLVKTSDIRLGDEVAVLGLGPIGIMAAKLAKLMGAKKVYGIVRSRKEDARTMLAKEFGVDEFIYTSETPLAEVQFPKGGVDKMMITGTPDLVSDAIPVMNYGGIISYIGISFGKHGIISFDANAFHFRKLQLRASFAAPALYFPQCLEMVESKMIDLEKLVTETFPLEKLPEAMCRLRDKDPDQIKMVMVRE